MKLEEVLQSGRKIEILIRDENKNTVLPTQVYLNKDETFLIKAPVVDYEINAPVGEKVEVWVGCYDAHYTFESEVISEKLFKDSMCWELDKPPVLTLSDRRSFFRVKTAMLVKWQRIEPEEVGDWESVHPSSVITLHDLSGSGLSFLYPVEVPVNSHLVFDIPLETENISINTTVLGVVIRNEPLEKAYRVGVKFENVTKLQQHMILQHLFSPWRRSIQLSSGF